MKAQMIKDDNGITQFVVLPVAEYERLAQLDEESYHDMAYDTGDNDDATIPHAVVSIMVEKQSSLLTAWRIYRNMTQADVEHKTNISQASLSQIEKVGKTPQRKTLEKLAVVYDCQIEQLTD